MASMTTEIPVSQYRCGQFETPAAPTSSAPAVPSPSAPATPSPSAPVLQAPDMEGAERATEVENRNYITETETLDIEQFKTTLEGLPPRARLYLLVDENLRQMFHTQYAEYTQVFAEITQSGKMVFIVSYIEDEEDFEEVKHKLPKKIRKNVVPREKFHNIANGLISITENDNMAVQLGDNNQIEVDTATGDFTGTQIGGSSTFHYRSEASVTGYVLTIKTPEADHQLDVSIKKHIDDNKEHINITLKDLHAEVTSTELGSVIIQVAVEEGTKIGPDWLKKLITRILSEDIISCLPQGTRMEVNIRASLPLNPLDVDIFDIHEDEIRMATDIKEHIVKDMVKLSTAPLADLGYQSYLIHHAASRGAVHIVKELLEAGIDAAQQTSDKNTPLHLAAKSGNVEIVDLLIKKGAKVKAVNDDMNTPLDMAIKAGKSECTEHLWIAGYPDRVVKSEEFHKDASDQRYKSAYLSKASGGEIAVVLLCSKANTEARDDRGNTPLHNAAEAGNTEVVEKLISYGADVRSLNSRKQTPLHVALTAGNFRCGLKLALNDTVNITDSNGNTPLHVIKKDSHAKLREYRTMRSQSDIKPILGTPLHAAVRSGNIEVIRTLIRLGEDVNAVDLKKQTPLHIISLEATTVRKSAIIETANEALKHILTKILAHNGNINAQNNEGNTLLHNAVLVEEETFAMEIMDRGADVTIVNYAGETVLHVLAKRRKTSTTLLNCVIEKGGDLNARDGNGETPLHVAITNENKEFGIALVNAGADIHIKNNKNTSPYNQVLRKRRSLYSLYQSMVSVAGADTTETDIPKGFMVHGTGVISGLDHYPSLCHHSYVSGWAQSKPYVLKWAQTENTSLHYAAMAGDLREMTDLLHSGADMHAKNKVGDTPLHILASTYSSPVSFKHKSVLISAIISGHPGDVNNARGETPLQVADHVHNQEARALFEEIDKAKQDKN